MDKGKTHQRKFLESFLKENEKPLDNEAIREVMDLLTLEDRDEVEQMFEVIGYNGNKQKFYDSLESEIRRALKEIPPEKRTHRSQLQISLDNIFGEKGESQTTSSKTAAPSEKEKAMDARAKKPANKERLRERQRRRAAIIDLIVDAESGAEDTDEWKAQLRSELSALKLAELDERAEQAGVDKAKLEEAYDPNPGDDRVRGGGKRRKKSKKRKSKKRKSKRRKSKRKSKRRKSRRR